MTRGYNIVVDGWAREGAFNFYLHSNPPSTLHSNLHKKYFKMLVFFHFATQSLRANGSTDWRTDGRIDKVSFRVACLQLIKLFRIMTYPCSTLNVLQVCLLYENCIEEDDNFWWIWINDDCSNMQQRPYRSADNTLRCALQPVFVMKIFWSSAKVSASPECISLFFF